MENEAPAVLPRDRGPGAHADLPLYATLFSLVFVVGFAVVVFVLSRRRRPRDVGKRAER